MPTYLFGLVLHTLNARPNSIDIAKVLSAKGGNGTIGCRGGDNIQVIVELVDQRSAGGDVELGNVILRDVVQMLDKGTEGVAMGGNDDVLSGLEVGSDLVLPVREYAVEGGGEGLGEVLVEGVAGVPRVVGGVVLGGGVNGGRGDVVRPAPDEDLLLAVLVDGLLLVEALEGAVVTFVELPCLVGGDPHEVGLLEDVPQSADGALQERRVGNGGFEALGLDELTGLDDLLVALGTERDIDPSGELVFQIPCGLSVTDKDKGRLVGSLGSGEAMRSYHIVSFVRERFIPMCNRGWWEGKIMSDVCQCVCRPKIQHMRKGAIAKKTTMQQRLPCQPHLLAGSLRATRDAFLRANILEIVAIRRRRRRMQRA